jgi:hypothetical protein
MRVRLKDESAIKELEIEEQIDLLSLRGKPPHCSFPLYRRRLVSG